jgi:hypothetical protein
MKRWELSRRRLLRGAGAAMALPLLEQMLPSVARAQAQGASAPRRIFAFYVPNGGYMQNWTPAQTGSGYTLSPILQPLGDAGLQPDVLVLTGLGNKPGDPRPEGSGDHDTGTGAFLTCMHPYKTTGADIKNGISMDQVAANALMGQTTFPSLQLGTSSTSNAGDCGSGYACIYMNNISWSGPTTALPKETNPQALFDRLFSSLPAPGSAGTGAVDAAAARRKAYKQSVIDSVRDDATRLRGLLGRSDQQKIDEYLTSVRELELQVQRIGTATATPSMCAPGTRPVAPTDIRTRLKAMLDLSFLAFQCDLTRVVSLMVEEGSSDYSFDFLGFPGSHHNEYSHHQASNWASGLTAIEKWHVSQLAYLLAKMKTSIDADGNSMLYNSSVFYSSEIDDGDAHGHLNMPVILAGSGGGAYTPGRHVVYSGGKFADLFISMLASVGVSLTGFGAEGTGPLANLKV